MSVRRYRCVLCRATQTVGPAEQLTRRLYSACAIVWALALFGLLKLKASTVRAKVSPWTTVGAASAARWDSLARWAQAAGRGTLLQCVRALPSEWSTRQLAARVAAIVAAHALPSLEPPPLDVMAFHGAAHAG